MTVDVKHFELLTHFFATPGFNEFAIEMLINILQCEVLLSKAGAHRCKWAATVNWKGGVGHNFEIDLFQENRNCEMKSGTHTHKSSADDEKLISRDLRNLRPFKMEDGRSFESFVGISHDPTHALDKVKFKEWIDRHKKTFCCIILVQRKLTNPASEHLNLNRIDLTDYSFLPDSLVSMLTNFRITSADGNDIPMFLQS